MDNNGRLSIVQSKKNANSGFWNYAKSFTYDAAGSITAMQLGNGLWENNAYNNRLQVTQIGVGHTSGANDVLKLEFSYGPALQNNGAIKEQKIIVPSVGAEQGFTAIQTYAYDDLNRLQSATENISGQQSWKQTFLYDRFGNRRFDAANTTTLGTCVQKICNPLINMSDNRFVGDQDADSVVDYQYDQAGSLIRDASGQRFGYDAENRQKEFFVASNGSSTPDATYFYDGDGRRVKKISSTETTVFVYDALGQLIAEYSTQISQTPKVSYLTTDHLGSPRVITNQNGAVTSRKDFNAFGDETITPQRTEGLSYVPPNVRQDYTGYQKDDESGLEFAQARYYNTMHGRFTSADPLTASASIRNPQTFNRYSYALNSPYKFTDPLGLAASLACHSSNKGTETSQCNRDTTEANQSANKPTVTVKITQRTKTYAVNGKTAAEAIADTKKQGQFAGHLRVSNFGVSPSRYINRYQYTPPGKNAETTVTGRISNLTVTATITTTLPEWTGYKTASPEEQANWDGYVADLKDHEQGHEEIGEQEANNLKGEIEELLPANSIVTFKTKSRNQPENNRRVDDALNYPEISSAITNAITRMQGRQKAYDDKTQHGLIPRKDVQY